MNAKEAALWLINNPGRCLLGKDKESVWFHGAAFTKNPTGSNNILVYLNQAPYEVPVHQPSRLTKRQIEEISTDGDGFALPDHVTQAIEQLIEDLDKAVHFSKSYGGWLRALQESPLKHMTLSELTEFLNVMEKYYG